MSRPLPLATLSLASLVALASASLAVPPQTSYVQPGPTGSAHVLPHFGFHSYNLHGIGERVTHVHQFSLASQLGLEPGDIILRLNGMPLSYHGAWNAALDAAVCQGDWVQLAIRDVRTGMVVYRQTFVGGAHGPVTPKSHAVGHAGPVMIHSQPGGHSHHINSPHVGQPGPLTAKSKKATPLQPQAPKLKQAAIQIGVQQLSQLINNKN